MTYRPGAIEIPPAGYVANLSGGVECRNAARCAEDALPRPTATQSSGGAQTPPRWSSDQPAQNNLPAAPVLAETKGMASVAGGLTSDLSSQARGSTNAGSHRAITDSRGGGRFISGGQRVLPATKQRYRVEGRDWTGHRHEIGYFFGRTPLEAIAECRRRKGHLCGGLRLAAEARL